MHARRTAGRWPTTTWSSPPARRPRPDQTPGHAGPGVAAQHLRLLHLRGRRRRWPTALRRFDHGRLVVHITEMPIKCPVAPLEFTFLADAWLRERGHPRPGRAGLRDAAVRARSPSRSPPAQLGAMLEERKIARRDRLHGRARSTPRRKALVSYDEREVPFDLLVTVPLNMGADFVARSGLGDELNYVPGRQAHPASPRRTPTSSPSATPPTSRPPRPARWRTSRSRSSSTTSSSTSPGRPMTGVVRRARQLLRRVRRRQGAAHRLQLRHRAAARASTRCPCVGPLSLLKETRANHLGKLAFRWIYWNVLLPGRPLPLPAHMSMAGKHVPNQPTSRRPDHARHHDRRPRRSTSTTRAS